MPMFPAASATPPPALITARTVGTLNLNDGVNSWADHPDEAQIAHNTYEQRVLASGQLIRTRQDTVAEVITVNGKWCDGGGRTWIQFHDAALSQSQVACDLGHGVKYALCDVVECTGTFQGIVGRDPGTGETLEAWAFSLKIQCMSSVRSP